MLSGHSQLRGTQMIQRSINMTSKSFAQGAFLNPEDSPEPSTIGEKSSYYRHPTVYDAVAGIYRLWTSTPC